MHSTVRAMIMEAQGAIEAQRRDITQTSGRVKRGQPSENPLASLLSQHKLLHNAEDICGFNECLSFER